MSALLESIQDTVNLVIGSSSLYNFTAIYKKLQILKETWRSARKAMNNWYIDK